MTGLAKQLCPGIHPDRAENWQDNGAEKILVQWKKNQQTSEIFLKPTLLSSSNRKLKRGNQGRSSKNFYWKYKLGSNVAYTWIPPTGTSPFDQYYLDRHFPGRGACPLIHTLNLLSGQVMGTGIRYSPHPTRVSTCFNTYTDCPWLQPYTCNVHLSWKSFHGFRATGMTLQSWYY